uniref:Zinc transporter ZIP14 n=1 Tax=Panagrolaimus sp. PS1159 TaxID=55785 RepID=A0AC35GTR9_9BILA
MEFLSNISSDKLKEICTERLGIETVDVLIHQHHHARPEAFLERLGIETVDVLIHHHHARPEAFLVWSLGLAFVTFISLSAAVGILFMKYMSKRLFDRFITFFVAVGVGTLSGSSVFHLLPQAFHLVKEFDEIADHSYLWKSFFAIAGIYLFFIADKLIKVILEARKRCKEYELKRFSGNNSESGVNSLETSHPRSRQSSDALVTYVKDGNARDPLVNNTDRNEAKESLHQTHSICAHDHDMVYNNGDSVIATVAWMIIFGDGLHNFIDGVSIGASFSESILSGLSVSVAVMCEEFPHELGDVAILVSAGMTLRQALMYNVLSALIVALFLLVHYLEI